MNTHRDLQILEVKSTHKKQAVPARGESNFETLLDVAGSGQAFENSPEDFAQQSTSRSHSRRSSRQALAVSSVSTERMAG